MSPQSSYRRGSHARLALTMPVLARLLLVAGAIVFADCGDLDVDEKKADITAIAILSRLTIKYMGRG